jgi:stress-induced morphogen
MAARKKEKLIDSDVMEVLQGLEAYRVIHPSAKIDSYRQNSASIRIRIIDPDFATMNRAARHDYVWGFIEGLSEDIQSQITILLLLTPQETKKSIANMDFENPIPSRL